MPKKRKSVKKSKKSRKSSKGSPSASARSNPRPPSTPQTPRPPSTPNTPKSGAPRGSSGLRFKVFQRWVNHYVGDISELSSLKAVSEGVHLCYLMRVLTGVDPAKGRRFIASPQNWEDKTINMDLVFNFMKARDPPVPLGVIRTDQVVGGAMKTIDELVWCLISHFELATWTQKENTSVKFFGESIVKFVNTEARGKTPAAHFPADFRDSSVLTRLLFRKFPEEVRREIAEEGAEANEEDLAKALLLASDIGVPPLLTAAEWPRADTKSLLVFYVMFLKAWAPLEDKEAPPPPVVEEPVENIELVMAREALAKNADLLVEKEALERENAAMKEELERLRVMEQEQDAFKAKFSASLEHNVDQMTLLQSKVAALQEELSTSASMCAEQHSRLRAIVHPPVPMAGAPKGDMALVATAVENISKLYAHDLRAATRAVVLHNQVIQMVTENYRGFEAYSKGDAYILAFQKTETAVQAALAIQTALLDVDWPEEILDTPYCAEQKDPNSGIVFRGLRVRCGIHHGTPVVSSDGFSGEKALTGPCMLALRRLAAAAHGGQVVMSEAAYRLVQPFLAQTSPPPGLQDIVTVNLGSHRLKGLKSAMGLYQVMPTSLAARDIPPTIRSARDIAQDKPGEDLEVRRAVAEDMLARLLEESTDVQQWLEDLRKKTDLANHDSKAIAADMRHLQGELTTGKNKELLLGMSDVYIVQQTQLILNEKINSVTESAASFDHRLREIQRAVEKEMNFLQAEKNAEPPGKWKHIVQGLRQDLKLKQSWIEQLKRERDALAGEVDRFVNVGNSKRVYYYRMPDHWVPPERKSEQKSGGIEPFPVPQRPKTARSATSRSDKVLSNTRGRAFSARLAYRSPTMEPEGLYGGDGDTKPITLNFRTPSSARAANGGAPGGSGEDSKDRSSGGEDGGGGAGGDGSGTGDGGDGGRGYGGSGSGRVEIETIEPISTGGRHLGALVEE